MNVEKQVQYWREGSLDDLEVGRLLLENGKVNQGLFFCHLAMKKALKALVWRKTGEVPPFIHQLAQLARLAEIELPEENRRFLTHANQFNLSGRYNVPPHPMLPNPDVVEFLQKTQEMVQWLTQL